MQRAIESFDNSCILTPSANSLMRGASLEEQDEFVMHICIKFQGINTHQVIFPGAYMQKILLHIMYHLLPHVIHP